MLEGSPLFCSTKSSYFGIELHLTPAVATVIWLFQLSRVTQKIVKKLYMFISVRSSYLIFFVNL